MIINFTANECLHGFYYYWSNAPQIGDEWDYTHEQYGERLLTQRMCYVVQPQTLSPGLVSR